MVYQVAVHYQLVAHKYFGYQLTNTKAGHEPATHERFGHSM